MSQSEYRSDERSHDRLFDQNKDQYDRIHENTRRIAEMQTTIHEIKTDIIGVTGRNGLRGEFRAFQERADKREEKMLEAMGAINTNLKWAIGTAIGLIGTGVAVMRIFL